MTLHLVPIRFRDAAAFVAMWHRHHGAPKGMVFAIGAADHNGVLRAVAIAGRPVARLYDNGQTLEVTRVAADGYRNACSLLYGACRRAAFALGYTRLITYTRTRIQGPVCATACLHGSCRLIRAAEPGSSLRATGWRVLAQRPAHNGWDRPSRPRTTTGTEHIPRTLWEATEPATA
jgi:hypothetical protein